MALCCDLGIPGDFQVYRVPAAVLNDLKTLTMLTFHILAFYSFSSSAMLSSFSFFEQDSKHLAKFRFKKKKVVSRVRVYKL